ncbi:MAG: response regulator [Deltaproteobacteria bacterium]|nr:response regulator [Deltaproteobacteria bacterium]
MEKDRELLEELLTIFKPEAEEYLSAISSALIELEKTAPGEAQKEIIETTYREVHSLKGAARSVNLTEAEGICQGLEGVFAALKRGERELSRDLFDRLHEEMDALGAVLASSCAEQAPPSTVQQILAPENIEKEVLRTVRISKSRQDALLLQVEELLGVKLATSQRISELRKINASFDAWKKEWGGIYPELQLMHQALHDSSDQVSGKWGAAAAKLFDFLDWNLHFIGSRQEELAALSTWAERDRRALSSIADELLDGMKVSLMLPASSSLAMLPKFVRDLSRDQGKEVDLVIEGGEIKIDRRIMEEMKDPLLHLVRNCIDHGIEGPAERAAKGKTLCGALTIAVSLKDGSKVEISISDDGAGIESTKVRDAAIRAGITSREHAAKMSEEQILPLVFRSGLTTSPIITTISGRGLGLAIVREKAEKLDGVISMETLAGKGTTFRITLPLSRATYRGVLIRAGDHHFVAPSLNVERVIRIKEEDIKTIENKEIIQVGGTALPFARLADIMNIGRGDRPGTAPQWWLAMILISSAKRMAILIDEVLREQEVLVRGLGSQLSRVRNISGATLLETGKVVPVLNVPDLMKSVMMISAALPGHDLGVQPTGNSRKSILVAEDSITSRVLLKNILEGAGYLVRTAVDGLDAFTQLRTESFHLVVSDVEMPRMSGVELTVRIRSDRSFSELPVILVTALESREDREAGIEAGANAYIVKGSFDQNNLLQVIERLI